MPRLGFLAGLAIDLARMAQHQLEFDRIVEVAADRYARVDPLKVDIAVARDLELLGYDFGVGHGERARTAACGVATAPLRLMAIPRKSLFDRYLQSRPPRRKSAP